MYRKGLLVVVSAPSGTGKGTLLKRLQEINSNIRLSVSATTRKPRDGESDGQSYFFKSVAEFETMIKNNELVEWVRYCDNYYGTPKKTIEDLMAQGYDVILEIEVEGALNIKKAFPESILVFILPPSFNELKRRIETRGTETDETMKKRLEKAHSEIMYFSRYEYAVINDTLDVAVEKLNSILTAEKLKVKRNENILGMIGF